MQRSTLALLIVLTGAPSSLVLAAPQRTRGGAKAPVAPVTGVAWWNASFADGKARARERNCPVVVMAVQDGEEASERWLQSMLGLPEFARLLDATVPLLTCPETGHATRQEKGSAVCGRFGAIPCDRHRQLAEETFELLCEKESVKTPQFVVLDPSGRVLERIYEVPGVQAYADALKKAGKTLGAAFTEAERSRGRELLTLAQSAATMARPGLLLPPLEALVRRNVPGGLQPDLLAARDAVRGLLEQRGEALAADWQAGKVFEAVRAARFLELDAQGLAAAQKARTVLDAAGKRDDAKDLRARVEREAQALLAVDKAREAVRSGGKVPLKELEQALKLAAGTPSEAEVQREVAALRASPGAGSGR